MKYGREGDGHCAGSGERQAAGSAARAGAGMASAAAVNAQPSSAAGRASHATGRTRREVAMVAPKEFRYQSALGSIDPGKNDEASGTSVSRARSDHKRLLS